MQLAQMEEGPQLAAVTLPAEGKLTPEWVVQLAGALDTASRAGASHLKTVLPPDVCAALLDRCQRVLHLEPTLLEVGVRRGGRALPAEIEVQVRWAAAAAVAAAALAPPLPHPVPLFALQVRPPTGGQVNVVGDTHGQYHDVCRM